jgi:hypothetical protein
VTQAETVNPQRADGPGAPSQADMAFDYGPTTPNGESMGGRTDTSVVLWRSVPLLVLLAIWLPRALASLPVAGRMQDDPLAWSGRLAPALDGRFGALGVILVAALVAGLTALGVWTLSRALNAPRWFSASLASYVIVAPLFGMAPWPIDNLDDAAFSALIVIAAGQTVWSARTEKGWPLFIAFTCATLAGLFRPGAMWMALLVGVAILLATRNLEERPWCGMFASLCWVPGLDLTTRLIRHNFNFDRMLIHADPARQTSRMFEFTMQSFVVGLLTFLPLIIFGAVTLVSLLIARRLKGGLARAATAGAVCAGIAALGAFGYGDLKAARFVLDPILLGLSGSLGLILPKLIASKPWLKAR